MSKEINYIAEIGWNFMGDMKLAEEMILKAHQSNASHVKFQYWREENLKKGEWDQDGRREIYKAAQLDKTKISQISSIANDIGIPAFFSVFNINDAEFIKSLKFNIIKIPSHEISNISLIKYCINNFETILLSAGACTKVELQNAVDVINASDRKIILMHCVSSYPCEYENANLKRIAYLRTISQNSTIGFSDHTDSIILPAAAAVYGAEVIEKHFTTNKDLPGRDNKFAMLPNQFKEMVKNHQEVKQGLIDKGIDYQPCEENTVQNYRGRWGK